MKDKKVPRIDFEPAASPETLNLLISLLQSHEWYTRENARLALTEIGEPAVVLLIGALANNDWHVRWEAAKALAEICDPSAAPALVGTLNDTRFGVRWLAAQGLICLGAGALQPVLQSLLHKGDSYWVRWGVQYVLHELMPKADPHIRDVLRPVTAALSGPEPSVEVPVAAKRALETLAQQRHERLLVA
jgi:HEAT repeat protein